MKERNFIKWLADQYAMKERNFIKWLADQYTERRSDVTDLCDVRAIIPEYRYVRAMIPNTDIEIEYDTLSTKIMYHRPLSQWKDCVHYEYYD